MANKFFVKPAKGLKIRMPGRPEKFLSEKGQEVPMTQYWLRRLRDGSVETAVSTTPAKKTGGDKS